MKRELVQDALDRIDEDLIQEALSFGLAVGAAPERKNDMEKFEYKVVTYDPKGFFGGNVEENQIEDQLNMLGNDGWEMVSCTSSNQSYGSTKSLVCIFKRKKID